MVEFGYAFFANRKLITVFSAARYTEDLCNYAAVVCIKPDLEVHLAQLQPIEYKQATGNRDETMDADEEGQQ